MQRFYTRPHVPVEIIKDFRLIFRILRFQINFNFQIFEKSPSQKTSGKDHSFYDTVSLKKPHSLHEPQLT